ncbi:kinase-like domain-containing protein [Roridomyces roridus]|uniref:Kinase-like domain-containing protein n=1 Tax=Roridomyces roridus TaxID=1738132 RepID=A0AAD7BEU0_9AGAR|nr:kinase-like domain-containing protein [Roridomyces roridus]
MLRQPATRPVRRPLSQARASVAKILLYETLISFLQEACEAKAKSSSRDRKETTRIQRLLEGYSASMAAESVVQALIHSLEDKRTLLDLSSQLGLVTDASLRDCLRADEDLISAHIVSIFDSTAMEQAVLTLEGDSAHGFLDLVQQVRSPDNSFPSDQLLQVLDRGALINQEHARKGCRIVRKLSETCDRLPSSFFITNVVERDLYPRFGGGFGDVYRARYEGQNVALKHMRHFLRGSELRDIRLRLCREALVWKDLNHPNILPFIGIDRETFPESLCMVSPWMENGTVLAYLAVHGRANVNKLLFEIAKGIQYLHSRNIVHGDLRGANILIKEDWVACLADFGLSSFTDLTSRTHTSNRAGSLYWMAPELIDPDRFGRKFIRTPATDVYAFGCVCFELYTGRPPFSELSETAALFKIIGGERAQRPVGEPSISDGLWSQITTYWDGDPASRPTIEIVLQNPVWPQERQDRANTTTTGEQEFQAPGVSGWPQVKLRTDKDGVAKEAWWMPRPSLQEDQPYPQQQLTQERPLPPSESAAVSLPSGVRALEVVWYLDLGVPNRGWRNWREMRTRV